VKALVDGRWVNLVAIEPGPSRIWIKEPQGDGAAFVPYVPETDAIPSAPSSWEWCRGHRGNVPPARIGPAARDHGSGEAVA
jgi:hypothetical protein